MSIVVEGLDIIYVFLRFLLCFTQYASEYFTILAWPLGKLQDYKPNLVELEYLIQSPEASRRL